MDRFDGNLKDLLNHNKKLKTAIIEGKTYYIKSPTIGEITTLHNKTLKALTEIAEERGLSINEDTLEEDLADIRAEFEFAINIGAYLCDKDGNLFFNIANKDELKSINSLDGTLINVLFEAIAENTPKK